MSVDSSSGGNKDSLDIILGSGLDDPKSDLSYSMDRLLNNNLLEGFSDKEIAKIGFSYNKTHKHFYNGIFRRNGYPYIAHIFEMHQTALQDGFRDTLVSQIITSHDSVEEYIRKNKKFLESAIEQETHRLESGELDDEQRRSLEKTIEYLNRDKNDPVNIQRWNDEAYELLEKECGFDEREIGIISSFSPALSNPDESKVEHLNRIISYSEEIEDVRPIVVKVYDLWHNSNDAHNMKVKSVEASMQRAQILSDYITSNKDKFSRDNIGFIREDVEVSDILLHRLQEVIGNSKKVLESKPKD